MDDRTERGAEYLDNFNGDVATIERLAALPPVEYDRVREDEAQRLGIRVGTLDREVQKRRTDTDNEAAGESVLFPDIDPWPEPVGGTELLDTLSDSASRYLILPSGAADVMALWVLHTYKHDDADVSPLLSLTSPTPECGKTTGLTWLGSLVDRPLPASNITAAALFRAVEKWRPTLLVDEADTFLRDSDELRGVLNSGHQRANAYVIRTVGEDHEPRRFTTWSPKAVALIGKLPATLASRSVHVELRRMAPNESVSPLRLDRLDHFEPLRQQAKRWAADTCLLDPDIPAELRGRAADNWRCLLAIADAAGGHWPERAREAAKTLTAGRSEEQAGILLLQDMRALFEHHDTDRLSSSEIVEALTAMEDRPWPEWRSGKALTQRGLAKLLEPFGIKPKQTRFPDGRSGISGYRIEAFTDAFQRYLDPSSTTLQPAPDGAFSDFPSSTADQGVELAGSPKPAPVGDCRVVEDEKGCAQDGNGQCPKCAGEGCGYCDEYARAEREAIQAESGEGF